MDRLEIIRILKEVYEYQFLGDLPKIIETLENTEFSKDEKHNGWTNYATWRVNLELFDGFILENHFSDPSELHDYLMDTAVNAVTRHGQIPDDSLAVSYALAFLDAVNWFEIALAIIDTNDKAVCEVCSCISDKSDMKGKLCEQCFADSGDK